MLYNLFENRDFVSVFAVALLAEGVDRNSLMAVICSSARVALLAEGVDRNFLAQCLLEPVDSSPSSRRAWIEIKLFVNILPLYGSPSSRRAWIEIFLMMINDDQRVVALLAEGVDRNL